MSKRSPLLVTLKAGVTGHLATNQLVSCSLFKSKFKPETDWNFAYTSGEVTSLGGGVVPWWRVGWWRDDRIPFTPTVRFFIPESVFYTQSVMFSPRFIPESVFYTQSVVRSPQSMFYTDRKSNMFFFGSLWTQQDGSGAKVKYSWLRLTSPSVFPVYQVNRTCSSDVQI